MLQQRTHLEMSRSSCLEAYSVPGRSPGQLSAAVIQGSLSMVTSAQLSPFIEAGDENLCHVPRVFPLPQPGGDTHASAHNVLVNSTLISSGTGIGKLVPSPCHSGLPALQHFILPLQPQPLILRRVTRSCGQVRSMHCLQPAPPCASPIPSVVPKSPVQASEFFKSTSVTR